jgi:hypothetical protein
LVFPAAEQGKTSRANPLLVFLLLLLLQSRENQRPAPQQQQENGKPKATQQQQENENGYIKSNILIKFFQKKGQPVKISFC